jgi:hypothetical protein
VFEQRYESASDRRENGPRQTPLAILFIFASILGFVGCQQRIVLQNISVAELPPSAQATDKIGFIPHFRVADQQSPWLQNGSENQGYVMFLADEVEFSWADGGIAPMTISIACLTTFSDGSHCDHDKCHVPTQTSVGETPHPLITGINPRIPLAVLAHAPGLIATLDPTHGTAFNLCNADNQSILDFELSPDTWAKVMAAFAVPATAGPKVKIRLVPHPARRVLPGDLIRATVLWQTKTDEGSPFGMAQVSSRVDAAGTALLPGLSSPTAGNAASGELGREWVSDTDYSQFQVPLWDSTQEFGQQLTLEEVGACLSAIWQFSAKPLTYAQAMCKKHGLDAYYYADDLTNVGRNNQHIRYRLEVDQLWTLITEDGRSFEQPLLPGTTVQDGVCDVLRKIGERECVVRQRGTFAVVIPRKELGSIDSAPFWCVLTGRRRCDVFNHVLLAPGDTVRLSDREPEQVVIKPMPAK